MRFQPQLYAVIQQQKTAENRNYTAKTVKEPQ